MVDSVDKRDFHRMVIDSDATVSTVDSSEIFATSVKDLSATGLQFQTSHDLAIGDMLNVHIEPGKSGITLPFHAKVQVVHVEEVIPEKEYSVGCKIVEMLPVEN